MKYCEKSARTQEEAIEEALKELNASITDVDVEVLDEGSKGLFGLFGSRLARVKVTLKGASEEESMLESLEKEVAPHVEPVVTPAASIKEPEPAKAPEPAAAVEPPVKKPETAESVTVEKGSDNHRPEPVRRTRSHNKGNNENKGKNQAKPAEPAPAKPVIKPLEPVVTVPVSEEELNGETPAATCKAFLQEITKLMGVNVEIALSKDEEGNLYAQMTGDTLGVLIGRRGETLDALQYLTSLRVNRNQDTYTRVTLDTENYRAKREDTLVRLANRMANRAVKTGRKVSLEPMNPYERRIIHSALQANDRVDTHSEGEDQNRHVVITLR